MAGTTFSLLPFFMIILKIVWHGAGELVCLDLKERWKLTSMRASAVWPPVETALTGVTYCESQWRFLHSTCVNASALRETPWTRWPQEAFRAQKPRLAAAPSPAAAVAQPGGPHAC